MSANPILGRDHIMLHHEWQRSGTRSRNGKSRFFDDQFLIPLLERGFSLQKGFLLIRGFSILLVFLLYDCIFGRLNLGLYDSSCNFFCCVFIWAICVAWVRTSDTTVTIVSAARMRHHWLALSLVMGVYMCKLREADYERSGDEMC